MPIAKARKSRPKNTRVQFAPDEHALVKAAAKKQLISFNQFVSGLAVAIARRVLEAPTESVTEKLAAQLWEAQGQPQVIADTSASSSPGACFCGHLKAAHTMGRECRTCGCAAFTSRR